MSFGNNPADRGPSQQSLDRLIAQADADRAARLAGHKSFFRRLLDRLRPNRQEPGGDQDSSYGV
jgi:hypothetical protein